MSDAYEDGLRLLARRSLTRQEVADRLAARGHDGRAVSGALVRLAAVAAIDDAALARHWLATTAAARGRGRTRALAQLVARGVAFETASAAWEHEVGEGAIDEEALLARAVRLRLGAARAPTPRGRLSRVYNALLFEGFTPERVEAALVPYGFERNEE